jgi:hypothetical protein
MAFFGFIAVGAAAGIAGYFAKKKGAVAKNAVDVTMDGTISIINQAIIDQSVRISQDQHIDISCPVRWSIIRENQYFGITTSAIQSSDFKNDVQQQLAAEFKQMAQAVAQQISLGGSASATNIANAVLKAAESLSNETVINNATDAVMQQNLNCSGSGASIFASIVTQNQIIEAVRQAVQAASVNNTAVQQLETIVDQTATAKIQNSLWIIAVLAVAVILVLLIFEGGTEKIGDDVVKGVLNWKFMLAIFPLVIVIIMAIVGIPPFISKKKLAEGKFQQIWYGSPSGGTPASCTQVCAQHQMQCGKGEITDDKGNPVTIGCDSMQTYSECWCAPCDKGTVLCNGSCCPPGAVCSENQCKTPAK